ncbi:MAG TPA: thioredoxin family protein [Vicinamibacteria bacterium]|nr:thioredoxin family protein [Vicinamibacteria bacterium]
MMIPLAVAFALAAPDPAIHARLPFEYGLETGKGGHGSGQPGIRWERQFPDALKKARRARKPVMVDFWADWCGWCHRLDQTTYVDPTVVKLSEDFVAVKVDTEGDPKGAAVAVRYDVTSLPTIAFLTPHGRPLMRLNGFQGPGQFPKTLEAAKEVAQRVMAWEDALERDPSNPDALAALGTHLFEQDAYRESRDLLARALKYDVRRPLEERKRSRLLLGAIEKSDHRYAEAETILRQALELPPSPEHDAKVLYVLGRMYDAWGRREQARVALQKVVQSYAQTSIAQKARESLGALEK